MCRISSGNLHHRRIVARSTGLLGLSGGFGKTSSKYEQITLDSTIVLPSCTSTEHEPTRIHLLEFGRKLLAPNKAHIAARPWHVLFRQNDADLLRAHRQIVMIEFDHRHLLTRPANT